MRVSSLLVDRAPVVSLPAHGARLGLKTPVGE